MTRNVFGENIFANQFLVKMQINLAKSLKIFHKIST